MKYYHPQSDFYNKLKLPVPEAISHGTEEDVSKRLVKLEAKSWRLEGNKLIAETEMGPVVNLIPTDYIMRGIDSNGLPILDKIKQ
jgi:hypothetical protein